MGFLKFLDSGKKEYSENKFNKSYKILPVFEADFTLGSVSPTVSIVSNILTTETFSNYLRILTLQSFLFLFTSADATPLVMNSNLFSLKDANRKKIQNLSYRCTTNEKKKVHL